MKKSRVPSRFAALLLSSALLGCFGSEGAGEDAPSPADGQNLVPLEALELDLRYAAAAVDSQGILYRLGPPDSLSGFGLHLSYWYREFVTDSIRTLAPDQGRLRLTFHSFRPPRSRMGTLLPPGARITPAFASVIPVDADGFSTAGTDRQWSGMRDLDGETGFRLVYVDTAAVVSFDTVGCDGKPVRASVRFRSRGFYALKTSDHPGKPRFEGLVPSRNLVFHHGPIGFIEHHKYLALGKCRDYSAYKAPVLGNWRLDSVWGVEGYRTKYLSLRKDDTAVFLAEEELGGRMETRSMFFATDSILYGARETGAYTLSADGDTLRLPNWLYVRLREGAPPAPWVHRLRKVREVGGAFRGITSMTTAGDRLLLVRSQGKRIDILRFDSAGDLRDSLGIARDSCPGSAAGSAVEDDRILWVNTDCGALRVDLGTGSMLPGTFNPREGIGFDSFSGKVILGIADSLLWTVGTRGRLTGNALDGSRFDTLPPLDAPRGRAPVLSQGRIYGTFINVHARRLDQAKDTLSFETEGAFAEMAVPWGGSLWILERDWSIPSETVNHASYRLKEYRRPGANAGEWLPLPPGPF